MTLLCLLSTFVTVRFFSVHALFFLSVKGKNEKIAIKLTNQYTRLLRNVDIFVVYRKEKER